MQEHQLKQQRGNLSNLRKTLTALKELLMLEDGSCFLKEFRTRRPAKHLGSIIWAGSQRGRVTGIKQTTHSNKSAVQRFLKHSIPQEALSDRMQSTKSSFRKSLKLNKCTTPTPHTLRANNTVESVSQTLPSLRDMLCCLQEAESSSAAQKSLRPTKAPGKDTVQLAELP